MNTNLIISTALTQIQRTVTLIKTDLVLTRAPTRSRCRSVVQGSRPIANSTYTHTHTHNRHKYRQTNWAIFLMLAGEKVWGHYSSTVLVYPLLFLCFSVELSFGWKCGVAIIWWCILLQAVAETVLLPYRINMVYVYSLNFPHYLPVLWNDSFGSILLICVNVSKFYASV